MKNIFFTIIISILYIYIFIYLLIVIFKNSATKKLNEALNKKDNKLFEKASNKLGAKLIKKYGVLNIKLDYYIEHNNHVEIENTIKMLNELTLKKNEIKKLYPKIFNYYIQRNNYNEAIKYYDKLKGLKYSYKTLVDSMYLAYIEHDSSSLEQTIKLLKKASKEDLPIIENTISKIYENMSDNPNAKKYRRLAEKHQKDLMLHKQ